MPARRRAGGVLLQRSIVGWVGVFGGQPFRFAREGGRWVGRPTGSGNRSPRREARTLGACARAIAAFYGDGPLVSAWEEGKVMR